MEVANLPEEAFKAVISRSDKAWQARAPWNTLYADAYDYAVPSRRPTAVKLAQSSKLYDMTAPMSAMYFAGRLQRDLFPPAQESFVIEAGPIAMQYLTLTAGEEAVKTVNREFDKTAKVMHPFFMTGEWDTCIHEACVDLAMGTAAILPIKGDQFEPLRFATIPFDEIAIWTDFFGKPNGISWMTEPERDQIYQMWPNAKFPKEFLDRNRTHPHEPVKLYQIWYKDAQPGGGWHFIARIDKMDTEIIHERMRTQPIAIPRYYRIPGEPYGRGVVLTALPAIKTLNKAQELALKSAAIQMLGIWAYRAGGTFNPNTVRMGPGEFWGMSSTGGIMGPDVQRLDPASGSLNVAQMVIGNLRDDVKQSMFDTRLPEYQGTPRAASEITGRLRQNADVHIGAFGRLVSEIMPVIVPRCAEILHEQRYLQTIQNIDNLLVAVRVRSPMAAALNADRLAAIANYIEMVGLIAGQQNVPLYADIEKVLDKVAKGFQIDPDLVPDAEQKKKITEDMQRAQQQQLDMMMAQEAAKAAPKAIAGMAQQEQKAAA